MAFTVFDYTVTDSQEAAILAGMAGRFTIGALVRLALKAGIPDYRRGSLHGRVPQIAVHRLLLRMGRTGKIRRLHSGVWELIEAGI